MPLTKAEKDIEQKYQNARMMAALLMSQIEVSAAEESLQKFVRLAWNVVEPGVAYIHGWHIDAICEHLEATVRTDANGVPDIRKLLINISPRTAKSTIFAVMFPAWVWVRKPEKKFLYSSYDLKLSHRDVRKCRTLVKSGWYQKHWGDRFTISKDQDTKERFDNSKVGFRAGVSPDAGTTGEGADVLGYDDLNDIGQMESDAYIEQIIYYHEQVMASRLNDPKTGVRISIQQRSNDRDITGHILEHEKGWEHLRIPMEYDPARSKVTCIGWSDPRTHEGELMCPNRIGPVEVKELRDRLRAGYAGQYQQMPTAGEGNKFKREYWNFWNPVGTTTEPVRIRIPGQDTIQKAPVPLPAAFEQTIQSWDMAFKEDVDTDYVCGMAFGRVGANVYLLPEKVHDRLDFTKSLAAVRWLSHPNRYPFPEKLVEDKANGPAVITTLKNEIPGIIPILPDGGKVGRANAVAPYCEAGNVFLPNPNLYPWVWDLIEECANFPKAAHDDYVDSLTQALRRMYDSMSNAAAPEFRVCPRVGEPETACHVREPEAMAAEVQPHWRRWIAVSPGQIGAVLWFCETPSGALRVYRELNISGIDAHEAGRLIAQHSLPDIRAFLGSIHQTARWNIDLLLEKPCFAPVEPIGSYAELLEQGILSWDSTKGDWEQRQGDNAVIRQAKFCCEIAETDDAAWDRLRDLLRFKPQDYEQVSYDRKKALEISNRDAKAFQEYLDAVEGKISGEYPKIRFSAACPNVVAALGGSRMEEDVTNAFTRALLIGICAPPSVMTKKPGRWVDATQVKRGVARSPMQGWARRLAMGR